MNSRLSQLMRLTPCMRQKLRWPTRVPRLPQACLLVSILFITAYPAHASELSGIDPDVDFTRLSIEQLMEIDIPTIYGASKYPQRVTDAPASVTVVTAEEIQLYWYRTLADILGSVRGFSVTYDRTYNYLGIRGLNRPGDYGSRVLLLVDGHRLNDVIYEQAAIGTDFPLDVDLIDRVEVIRGPSSSIYGASAFLGVINVVTRQGRNIKGVEVAGSAASQDAFQGRISFGNKYANGLELLLSGTAYTSAGKRRIYYPELATPEQNSGVAEHQDGDRAYRFYNSFSLGHFTVSGAYSTRQKETPTGSFFTILDDNRNRVTDNRGFLNIGYRRTFGQNGTVSGSVGYNFYRYHGDYVYEGDDPGNPRLLNRDYARGQEIQTELQYTRHLFEQHLLTAGIDVRYLFRQDQHSFIEDPHEVLLDDRRTSTIWGIFIQDEFHLLSNLILTAGVRHDQYTTFGGTTNPRLAVVYKPLERTVLKALYGTAFRAPNVYELYYSDGIILPNPDLGPEKITTYELVWEQYLGDHLRSSLSGFYYEADRLIDQQPRADGGYLLANLGAVKARGVEAELEGKWADGYQGKLSYTYHDARDQRTDAVLSNSPRHLAKINLVSPLIKRKIFVAPEIQYTGPRLTRSGSTAGGFLTTALTVSGRQLLPGLDISASVYNLFDKKYGDPVPADFRQETIPRDGRVVRMKVTWRF